MFFAKIEVIEKIKKVIYSLAIISIVSMMLCSCDSSGDSSNGTSYSHSNLGGSELGLISFNLDIPYIDIGIKAYDNVLNDGAVISADKGADINLSIVR